jgi:hypothetical protein
MDILLLHNFLESNTVACFQTLVAAHISNMVKDVEPDRMVKIGLAMANPLF